MADSSYAIIALGEGSYRQAERELAVGDLVDGAQSGPSPATLVRDAPGQGVQPETAAPDGWYRSGVAMSASGTTYREPSQGGQPAVYRRPQSPPICHGAAGALKASGPSMKFWRDVTMRSRGSDGNG